jgi:transposase
MIYVGIDVSKDKHDCSILSSNGQVLAKPFSIPNNLQGFTCLLEAISSFEKNLDKVKVGLEATGHYSFNILGYLLEKGFHCFVFNPLHTNLYRKAFSLRKTKTDKVDSKMIAKMLLSEVDIKPYSKALYHNEQLKSLTRYRFFKIRERANLKQQLSRLVNLLFPELESLVPTLHISSVYALLEEFPGASFVAKAHLTKLTNLLCSASKGHYKKDKAISIKETAASSIGCVMPAKSLELKHTIQLIRILSEEINEIELQIKEILEKINSPITSIPGIGFRMAAMILAEIGDFSNFDSPDKILAFAGISPSTYQSGKLENAYAHMEKRGSRYLRYALYNAAIYVCNWDPTFSAYLQKKRSEGKHYYVAISHAIKKLVRVIYSLEKTGQTYTLTA